jgi:hypothetical protein
MYGKAGAVRAKSYGVEYRVLSNFWLKSEELMGEVYDRAVSAAKNLDKLPKVLDLCSSQHMQSIINNSDRGEALRTLIKIEKLI